jgi:hypothetical protein
VEREVVRLVWPDALRIDSLVIAVATLDSIASVLAGRRTQIVCDSPATEGGHVQFDGWIHLQPGICYRLEHPMGNAYELGASVLMFEHEIEHIALDTGDEGAVECSAITQVAATMKLLFRFPAAYMRKALIAAYAFHAIMPVAYRTHC